MEQRNFFSWHYLAANKFLWQVWRNFIEFGLHIFSVKLILKTLFTPWRRVEVKKQGAGFSLSEWFENFTFNLISRAVGFFVRLIFIFGGLLFTLSFFFIGAVLILVWQLLLPVSWVIFFAQLLYKSTAKAGKISPKAKRFVWERLAIKTEAELKTVSPQDLQAVMVWYQKIQTDEDKKKRWWEKENLLKTPALGNNLSFGYTNELDKYCQDLSLPPSFYHQLIGREKEIKQIQAVLNRAAQGNILLIGEPGVGKHTILLGFAKAIQEQRVDPQLFYKRVLKVDMNLLFGQEAALTSAKAHFSQVLAEAESAGNIILVIDQIERYVNREVGMDLTDVIGPAVLSSRIQIIGVTTPTNYERYIVPNEAMAKYFETVEVSSATKEEALDILERILPNLEKGKKTVITYPALKEIVDQSDKLITNIPFPEKAIDLTDQLISEANSAGRKLILKLDVDNLISQKVKVPVGTLSKKEAQKLKDLPAILHKRVVDQEEAINSLASAMQRSRLQISEAEKPIGTFLFLGPTGVGKTETAKALAEAYFGSDKEVIRFDMSEYQGETALITLIGASTTDKPGLLVKEAREKPFGVLLLDEFEKANKDILNLFLTVFDEGYLKDPNGKAISFKNMIIICTSNAAAEFIREKNNLKPPPVQDKLKTEVIEYILQRGIFSPEMVNRFDAVTVYKPLELVHVTKIAQMMMERLNTRLQTKGITLEVDASVYTLLVNQGYSFQFGARPMKRLIADKIESLIAKAMLENKITKGNKIKLTVDPNGKEFRIDK